MPDLWRLAGLLKREWGWRWGAGGGVDAESGWGQEAA